MVIVNLCLWLCRRVLFVVFFFFKQKTAYELRISDWSSDVCSSDLRKVATEKDGWTVVTRDGKLSAQFEHTVAVTETGVEVLTLRRDERVYGEGVKP